MGDGPSAPDYDDGWWGFVSKDLRGIYSPLSVRGRWSRGYCGGGSRVLCRQVLSKSLKSALAVTPEERRRTYEEFWGSAGFGFVFPFGSLVFSPDSAPEPLGKLAAKVLVSICADSKIAPSAPSVSAS